MSKVSFNVDSIEALKKAKASLEEIVPIMKKGVANSVEVAKESGATKYIASAVAMETTTPELVNKTIPELIECLETLIKHYEHINDEL